MVMSRPHFFDFLRLRVARHKDAGILMLQNHAGDPSGGMERQIEVNECRDYRIVNMVVLPVRVQSCGRPQHRLGNGRTGIAWSTGAANKKPICGGAFRHVVHSEDVFPHFDARAQVRRRGRAGAYRVGCGVRRAPC